MSAEIVSLNAVRATRADPILSQVEGYWDGLRAGRPVPSRAEVDPRGLSGVLESCFVAEQIAPGMARIRIAGQTVCNLMGQEARGLPFSMVFSPDSRDQLENVVTRVFSNPATCHLMINRPRGFKRSHVEGQMLLLPLRSDLGQISRILGCISMPAADGPKPIRFDIQSVLERQIPLNVDYVGAVQQGDVPTVVAAPTEANVIRLPFGTEQP